MVIEALARGRHVVWSRELPGVICARTPEEVVATLQRLYDDHARGMLRLNVEGLESVTESYTAERVTHRFEGFLDQLLDSSTRIYPHSANAPRRRAVVSGETERIIDFIRETRSHAPEWDIHPLMGRSKSQKLDDLLSIAACERWFRLDERQDRFLKNAGTFLRKVPTVVDVSAGTSLSSLRKKRRPSRKVAFTKREWRAFDACHPAPTFFARPAWGLALERAFGGMTAEPTLFSLDEGEALLPMMRSGKRFVTVEAMPLGSYSLPLRLDGEAVDPTLAAAIVRRIVDNGADVFSGAFWPLANFSNLGACSEVMHETAVIDLRDGAEAALERFKGVARRMAGQAVRKGVSVGREPDAIGIYYGLLEESARRWGMKRPHLPRELFEAVVEFGGDDVEIWIARYKGEAIAGGVMLYGSREAFFWSAALRAEYADLRPSNLLNTEMIRGASERGMQWYNLGASEGLPGVARFKESLGAEFINYSSMTWQSQLYKNYLKLRALVRRNGNGKAAANAGNDSLDEVSV